MAVKTSLFREALRLLVPYWRLVVPATAMGGMSSIATVLLLSRIEDGLRSGLGADAMAPFAGLCALMLASEIVGGIGNNFVGQYVIADIRKSLARKILGAPIAEIERLQRHRLLATLTQDVETVSLFTRNLSYLLIATFATLGCLSYLVVLSPRMSLVLIVSATIPNLVVRRAHRLGFKAWDAERTAVDEMQKQYGALIDGAKELRINRDRRLRFQKDRLFKIIDYVRDRSRNAASVFAAAEAIDSTAIFIVIGVLMAYGTALGVENAVLGGFVVTLLYMKGPLNYVIGYLPMFSRATVSFERILELSSNFVASEPYLLEELPRQAELEVDAIELSSVEYAYPVVGDALPFVLGPIDLVINRGETLFIVGENGSGKTTLLKLILGLYEPMQGDILIDGKAVTRQSRDDYRQHFSAIFFDYYLFEDVIVPDDETAVSAAAYLARMELAHKVRIESGAFSTTALSAGQRKRLALVSAYGERRPVMVFDEWAAEQDPTFRRVFYREILPDLKRQGKTLIVVSHDDRYFDAADRIIHIDNGVVSLESVTVHT